MSNSALISETVLANANNYWGDRKGAKINKIIIHHMAAVWTAKRCAQSFQDPNRGASANYCIGYSGETVLSVPEDLCAGTSGGTKNGVKVNGFEIDRYAITIEVSNSAMGGDWKVSDAALKSLINLCADIAKRYNFGRLVKGKNLCWHQMYAATACPGPYLLSKMDYICDEVNKRFEKDTAKGFLTGVNISRAADALVMYCNPIVEAPTNKWGFEIACDRRGVAICDPVYGKGHMSVPEGGRVYSGHGKGGDFINKLKKGYRVWVEDGRVLFNTRQHRSVDGEDCARGTDKLIVYKSNAVKRNIWGCEVAVLNGTAVNTPVYGKCNIDIPKGGFVISGHGAAAWWMLKNVKKGVKVSYEGNVVTVG